MLKTVGKLIGQGKNNKTTAKNSASIMDVHNAHYQMQSVFW